MKVTTRSLHQALPGLAQHSALGLSFNLFGGIFSETDLHQTMLSPV